jgi:hypothetical protein
MSRLISTTALICVGWLSALFSPASAAGRRGDAPDLSLLPDNNRKFLCDHGYDVNSHTWVSQSGSNYRTHWHAVATPIKGRGKTVSEIIVADAPRHKTSFGFYVVLDEDVNGKPGYGIDSASVTSSGSECRLITVPITPITLTRGKQYWVVEFGEVDFVKGNTGGKWLFDADQDDHLKNHAMYDDGFYCCCSTCDSSSSNGWARETGSADKLYVRIK